MLAPPGGGHRRNRRTDVIGAGLVAPTGAEGVTIGGGNSTNLNPLGAPGGLDNVDTRTGTVAPSSTQLSAVSALVPLPGGTGSPQSLIGYGGYLATGLSSDAPSAARAFLSSKAALFRLTTAQVAALPLLNDQRMAGNTGHAVLFRQKFGTLTSPIDGMVTVGVTGGKVAYVPSSLAPTTSVPGGASMPDDEPGSRFTALRQFQLDVCTQTVTNTCLAAAANGTQGWALHYTSPEDAFPGVLARRLAPDLLLRHVRRHGHVRHARPAGRATEPVQRGAGVPGRAGRRPDQRHRL